MCHIHTIQYTLYLSKKKKKNHNYMLILSSTNHIIRTQCGYFRSIHWQSFKNVQSTSSHFTHKWNQRLTVTSKRIESCTMAWINYVLVIYSQLSEFFISCFPCIHIALLSVAPYFTHSKPFTNYTFGRYIIHAYSAFPPLSLDRPLLLFLITFHATVTLFHTICTYCIYGIQF